MRTLHDFQNQLQIHHHVQIYKSQLTTFQIVGNFLNQSTTDSYQG